MGVAERVSRRNVTGAARLAVQTTEQCVEQLDALTVRHNHVVDAIGELQKKAAAHTTVHAELTKRVDAQGEMLLTVERQVDALPLAIKMLATSSELRAVNFDARQIYGLSFFGRLRWLFTGRVA